MNSQVYRSLEGFDGSKFVVTARNGSTAPGGKHHSCRYFPLDITHDPIAREAAALYADRVEATNPKLAADLREAIRATVP